MATDEIGMLAAKLGVSREVVVAITGERPSAAALEVVRQHAEQQRRADIKLLRDAFLRGLRSGSA